jgi:dTDP-L-rhamnose 4-epimerase
MKVLVTGGAGFIGSHLADLLVDRGIETVVLDNLDPQVHGEGASDPVNLADHVRSGALRFERGDVREPPAWDRCLDGVDSVIHLAAAVGVGQSMYRPDYYIDTNCGGTGTLLRWLADHPARVRKLIVASSMSLYGEGAYHCPSCGGSTALEREGPQLARGQWDPLCSGCGGVLVAKPTAEEKPPEIASVYAATKKHQEDLCVAFGRAYEIPTFALRFFNVIGPRQSLANPYTGVAAIFLSRLMNDRPPLIYEDGGQTRDFIDVRDVAMAILRAIEYKGSGTHVLNIGTGRSTAVATLARMLARQLGRTTEPEALGRFRAGDIRHCYADPSKAREELGFEARWTLDAALESLIAWCRQQKADDRVLAEHESLVARGLVR